ncbi:MAG: ABC transporter permease [Bacteroidia bacterium]|nr:ABC transporter permease [Bacteroidia bacterium]
MEYEIKPAGRLTLNLPELWDFRELIYFFTWRDIKIKYKQTFLGGMWALLQPFLLMVVFTLFFSRGLKISTGNLPYPVFVFPGLLLWNIFSNGVTNSGNSMVNNANIIKKIYFPRLIIPVSSILSTLIDFFIGFLLFIVLLIYYRVPVDPGRLLYAFPASLIIILITTLGVGTLLASLNVKYRDFRYVIPFMVQILLFLTPVIYPVTVVPEGLIRDLFQLNPLAGAISLLRSCFGYDYEVGFHLMGGTALSIILLVAGLVYFRKTEYYFADLA